MKKFRVWAKNVSFSYVEIEAKNEEEAVAKGDDIDGGDFREDEGSGYWEVFEAEELENENKQR